MNEGFRVPIFSYFLIVGSVLTTLLFYATNVIGPAPLPFSVSQNTGLPAPFKAPLVVAEAPKPAIIATAVEPTLEVEKPLKAIRITKSGQVNRQPVMQERYAAYPPRDVGG